MFNRQTPALAVAVFAALGAACDDPAVLATVPSVLSVARGADSPGVGFVSAGADDVLVLSIDTTLDDSSETTLTSLDIAVSGATAAISSLALVLDDGEAIGPALLDGDGVARFQVDLGYAPGEARGFDVVAKVGDDAPQASAFVVSFAGAAGVVDADDNVKMTTSGGATGSPLEVRSAALLTLSASGTNPPAQTALVGDDAVALAFDASAGEDVAVRVSDVVVALAGDAAFDQAIGGATLFVDENRDGAFDAAVDDSLAVVAAPGFGDTALVFSGLDLVVQPTTTAHLAVVVEIAAGAVSGTVLQLAIDADSQVTAQDAITSNPALVQGAPVDGGSVTLDDGAGGLEVAVGGATPAPSSFASEATGVSLLQARLSASALEPIAISELRVERSGSGDDDDVVRAALFADVDGDGLLSQGDRQLGDGATFLGGEAVFELGDDLLLDAAASVEVIVVFDFAQLQSGRTFVATIAPGGVRGVGTRSGRELASLGEAEGEVHTSVGFGSLVITLGTQTPGAANESAAASRVLMTQASFRAGDNEDVIVDSVTLRAAGTLNDPSSVTRTQLFVDDNENGAIDAPADIAIGGDQAYDVDNGTVTFAGLDLRVPAGQRRSVLVAYDLSGAGFAGQSFSASINSPAAVVAHGAGSGEVIDPSGVANGALKTIQFGGSLAIALGASSPGASNESAAGRVEMLQLSLTAGSVEDVELERLLVRANGTANDLLDVSTVRLFRDVDDDGRAGPGDDELGSARFDADNGTAELVFEGVAAVTLGAGTRTTYVVVYELAGSALPGLSFQASVANVGAVTGRGVLSDTAIVASGAATGSVKTIQGRGTLALAVGANTPGATAEASSASGVGMLQLTLTASTVEDIDVSQLVVRAAGTADDRTLVASVALFDDGDGDGLAAPGATPLATVAGFNSDNGTTTFSGLNVRVPLGQTRTLLVTWDLGGGALPGQTFQAAVVGAGVRAAGVASASEIVVSGTATGAVKQIQGAGAMNVVLGANTPGASVVAANATNLELFQFTITTNGVESIAVDEVDVRAGGTADDARAVSVVELFLDADRNGRVGAADRLLGSIGGFTEDNGVAAFRDVDLVLPSASQTSFLVRYQLSGGGLPGQSLNAALAALSFIGTGVSSNVEIFAGGAATGALKTIQGAGTVNVALGANSPGSTVVAADAATVEVLQVTATTNATEAVRVSTIGVRAGGTLDDALGVSSVELFVDTDKDGRVTNVDRRLGVVAGFSEDNGIATFAGLNELMPAATQTAFVVRYALSGAGQAAQTFNASILALAFVGVGAESNVEIVAGGAATGAVKSIQNRGALTLAAGVRTPGASIVSASTLGVPVLQLLLTANNVEDVAVDSVIVRAAGTADDADDVAAVRLFRDRDGDGAVSAGDTQLGGNGRFTSDNGTVTFSGFSDVIAANAAVAYLVVYDLTGTASGNETLNAAVQNGLAIGARGVSSSTAVVTGGAAQGANLTIRNNPLVVSAGAQNPAPESVRPNDGSVVAAQLTVTVANGEDLVVDAINVTAAGTGNDATGISGVSLIRDANADGVIGAGDLALGGTVVYASDNATARFAGLAERLTGPASASYLVVYDLSGAALPNQTFQARTANAAAIEAVDARSRQPVVSGGVAVNGGLLTIIGDTNFWTTLPTLGAPRGRSDHTASAIGRRMFVFGGVDANGARGDGGVFDVATNSWSALPLGGAPPSARSNHVGAAVGTDLVVFGGFDSALAALGTGAVLDTTTGTWTATTTTAAPAARALVAATATADRVFVFGGVTSDGVALGDGALYDPANDTWEPLPAAGAPTARYNAVARLLPNLGAAGRVLVAGGFNGTTFLADGFLFDLATRAWSSTAAAPAVFSAAAAAVIGNRVVVEGGQNASGPAATAQMYDATSNTWRALPTTGAPSARVGHVGVAINGRAIFHGGFNGTSFLQTGARFSPVTDLWSPTATAGAPSAQAGHSAIVVDGKMIVWGGLADNTFLNNGSAYTP